MTELEVWWCSPNSVFTSDRVNGIKHPRAAAETTQPVRTIPSMCCIELGLLLSLMKVLAEDKRTRRERKDLTLSAEGDLPKYEGQEG